MTVAEVISVLEAIAPPRYAAEWDNVGLLVGARSWSAGSVMLTIDLTESVLDEAVEHEIQMIIAYHPPIFAPLKTLTDRSPTERVALNAAAAQIAIYSPHTALDATPGGVNDWLASGLGVGDVRALEPEAAIPASEDHKIVTFCPRDAADGLRNALGSVGAGTIGAYELCSFEVMGHGTFLGGVGAKPAVGRKGVLERVPETRLEMVCPQSALPLIVLTLKEFHPYEEPPIEIYRLQPRPQRSIGAGRRVVLDRKCTQNQIVERLKKHLGVKQIRVAPARQPPRRFQTIGLSAGAGGSLLDTAIEQRCELFLTGEMRHHDVLAAQARGCTIMLAGHTNTERGYLKPLRKRLAAALPDRRFSVARRDADPLQVM